MSKIQVDNIVNKLDTGAPNFPNGLTVTAGGVNVTGVVTATSFSGNGSSLTGISAGIATSKAFTMSVLFS